MGSEPRWNVAILISGKRAAGYSIWDDPNPLKFPHYSSQYKVHIVHYIEVYFRKYVDWNTLFDFSVYLSV